MYVTVIFLLYSFILVLYIAFLGTHENPELIWNDDARDKVSETVKRMKDQ